MLFAEGNTVLREFMASGHTLSPPALEAVASVVEKSSSLVKMGVGNEALGDEGVRIICGGVAKSRGLECLELDMKGMGPAGAEALAKALGDNRSIHA